MTLTKADIIQSLQNELDFSKRNSSYLVETVIETIRKSLESGDDVLISGFGKFCVNGKKARRGRNPATGGSMILDARRVVTFKCSGKLRDRINGS